MLSDISLKDNEFNHLEMIKKEYKCEYGDLLVFLKRAKENVVENNRSQSNLLDRDINWIEKEIENGNNDDKLNDW